MTATHRKDSTIKHCTVTPKQHENEEMPVKVPHQNTKNQNQKRNTLRANTKNEHHHTYKEIPMKDTPQNIKKQALTFKM
jgi:hypothetical protein